MTLKHVAPIWYCQCSNYIKLNISVYRNAVKFTLKWAKRFKKRACNRAHAQEPQPGSAQPSPPQSLFQPELGQLQPTRITWLPRYNSQKTWRSPYWSPAAQTPTFKFQCKQWLPISGKLKLWAMTEPNIVYMMPKSEPGTDILNSFLTFGMCRANAVQFVVEPKWWDDRCWKSVQGSCMWTLSEPPVRKKCSWADLGCSFAWVRMRGWDGEGALGAAWPPLFLGGFGFGTSERPWRLIWRASEEYLWNIWQSWIDRKIWGCMLNESNFDMIACRVRSHVPWWKISHQIFTFALQQLPIPGEMPSEIHLRLWIEFTRGAV